MFTKEFIKEKYTRFNGLYFDNVLPDINDVPIELYKSRQKFIGRASCYDMNRDGVVSSFKLEFVNYVDYDDDTMCSIILHEMIHLEDFVLNPDHNLSRYYDAHGSWFLAEADRVTRESGYKITVKQDVVDNAFTNKVGYVILVNDKIYGECFLCMYEKEYDKIANLESPFSATRLTPKEVYKCNTNIPDDFANLQYNTAKRIESGRAYMYKLDDSAKKSLEKYYELKEVF